MPSGPKSNKYTNRHAAEARERQQEREAQAKAERAKAAEDALWANTDDDPKQQRRMARQREAEAKAQREAELRAERKEQLLQEERELSQKAPQKVTRRQIQKELSKMLSDYDKVKKQQEQQQHGAVVNSETTALPEGGNPNRAGNKNTNSGYNESSGNEINATGSVGEVLSAVQSGMTGGPSVPDNRHIGKRARVLYRHFCDEQLPMLREEKPGLRRTQYNDLLWEMWQKSPTNPFVQRNELRSKERLEEERRWMEQGDDDSEGGEGNDDGEGKK
ncbi:Coiled-coil domain-containing protein 124/Oxs1 [Trypanosoma melophagium]|uniref:Coiled-coil domain-containing protein 124/Oxs1 n=1 Tax=Trypanosoma melophagium TaxID=715481 RepID=UPI003519EB81|nr:Coiled-coil domain-containing protein 124/Oxs1 [Trypanosoma melophagium]